MKKITAIIRTELLSDVEKALLSVPVSGLTVSRVRGLGEDLNLFGQDLHTPHTRLEVIAGDGQARTIVAAILKSAHTGSAGDGVIAVTPLESVYRIRDQRAVAET